MSKKNPSRKLAGPCKNWVGLAKGRNMMQVLTAERLLPLHFTFLMAAGSKQIWEARSRGERQSDFFWHPAKAILPNMQKSKLSKKKECTKIVLLFKNLILKILSHPRMHKYAAILPNMQRGVVFNIISKILSHPSMHKYAAILPNMQRGCGCWAICQAFPPSPLLLS